MNPTRKVKRILKSVPTIEGAGVHLHRAFGYHQKPQFDPFLLLDNFHSNIPNEYISGFPWHPHRGIETITYLLYGAVEHGDSLGNEGTISAGDVQWMTAGSGIIHQEMPKGREDGLLWGLQLWANLPASQKMMAPRYRDITSDQIPEVSLDGEVKVKIIAGNVNSTRGPVQDIVIDPEYLDVTIPPEANFTHRVESGYTVFAYVLTGKGRFDPESAPCDSGQEGMVDPDSLVDFADGEDVSITAGDEGVRFLLISGKPLQEPVAWSGPIVMNTQEELRIAFAEFRNGTFLKHKI